MTRLEPPLAARTSLATGAVPDGHPGPGLRVPGSIAVVGASPPDGGSYYGGRLISNVVDAAPTATVYPVNPRYAGQEILGHRTYASLSDLPEPPDLVLIGTQAGTTLRVLDEAGLLGVPACVVITAHLGVEAERRAFDAEVAALAKRYGMLVIGPNSVGILNGNAAVNASFATGADGGALRPGGVAVLGQSGAVISYLLQAFRERSLGYSWLISTGNEAAVSMEELFDGVVDDVDTHVVLLFVEGVGDGPRFRRAALRARIAGKAVVMLNAGRSESGRHAVQSHTGRIAGTAAVLEAVADESGILTVRSYQELFDAAVALSTQAATRLTRPHGRRAAVLTTSGGAGTVTVDGLSDRGWTLPPLRPDIRAALEEICGQRELGNPVDVTGAFANRDRLARMLVELGRDETLDALVIATGAGGPRAQGMAEELEAVRARIPQEVYIGWIGLSPAARAPLDRGGMAVYEDPSRAVVAAEYSARFRLGAGPGRIDSRRELLAVLDTAVNGRRPADGAPAARDAHRGERGALDDHPQETVWTSATSLGRLGDAGLACAAMRLTDTVDAGEAGRAAKQVGYPVAVKLDSPSLNHKTDAGGVVLDLRDETAVREAATGLGRIARNGGLRTPRILVQRMVSGIEVLAGLKRDPAFGLMLVVGLGGIRAELFADVVGTLLPTTRAELVRRLTGHRTLTALLSGYRGAPPADGDALVDLLWRFADWAIREGDSLVEADLNPVMVNEDGAVVVDARVVTR